METNKPLCDSGTAVSTCIQCHIHIHKKSSVLNGAIIEIARNTRFVVSGFAPHIRPPFEMDVP